MNFLLMFLNSSYSEAGALYPFTWDKWVRKHTMRPLDDLSQDAFFVPQSGMVVYFR